MRKLLAVLLITPAMALAQSAPTARPTTIHSFHAPAAALPLGGLVEGADGAFYGMAVLGGTGSQTVSEMMYRITPDGLMTVIHVFGDADVFAFAPEAPANLIASATSTSGTADGEVRLTWDPVRDANTYEIHCGTFSGSLTPCHGGTALTTTNTLVTGLTPGVRYYFAVVAVNEAGASTRSAEASAIPAGLAPVVGGAVQPESSGGGGSLGVLMLAILLAMLVAVRTPRAVPSSTRR